MTTHFLVPGHEGSVVRVSRTSRASWIISIPLASGLQGTLPDISGSFGYPVQFTCSCISMNSCVCSHETVYKFWRSVADFLSYIADVGRSPSLLCDSIRKRFVKFYVDLPVLELSQGNDTESPRELREALIREAKSIFNHSLDFDPWPSESVSVEDDAYSRLFASDIEQLSQLRIAAEKNAQIHDLPGNGLDHFNDLVGSTWSSPIEIFQAASVLDQINLVDISSHLLTYAKDLISEPHFPPIDSSFLIHINSTLCDRNPMKWSFLPHASTHGDDQQTIPPKENLDKFRAKLSKLLQFKQQARRGQCKAYIPVYASDTEDDQHVNSDPVETYLVSKRHEIEPPKLVSRNDDSSDMGSSELELVAEFFGPDYTPPRPGLPSSAAAVLGRSRQRV